MFNKNVLDVLSQVNNITNSVILKYPQTVAISEASDIQVLIDVSKLDSDPFEPIGLNQSLGDLLSVFKLFPEGRSVEIDGNTITVSQGKSSSTYITDNIALMDFYDKDSVQFERTEEVPTVAQFELDVEDIKNLKQSFGVFKTLDEVILTSKDGEMTVSLGATNKFNAKSNTYSINKQSVTSKEFVQRIPVENFKSIPVSTYDVEVKYNSSRDAYRLLLTNKTIDGFKILMSFIV